MTKLTTKERHALEAIAEAGRRAAGNAQDGWWSGEILLYAPQCFPYPPRAFSAACGSLAKKGLTASGKSDGLWHISITGKGMDVLGTGERKYPEA